MQFAYIKSLFVLSNLWDLEFFCSLIQEHRQMHISLLGMGLFVAGHWVEK